MATTRPLTREQQLQNAAFLRALRRTGNVRLAAREVGVSYGTIQHRRGRHAAFAVRWDAALVFAQARFAKRGVRGPSAPRGVADPHRTSGGEPVVVRRNDGRLQLRRAQPGKLTQQCEQAFLAALSATCNVSLAAAAAGAAEAAFHRRRRRNPGFAREWRLALQEGYDRLELALLASVQPGAFEDDHWRRNARPEMPPMTPNQALQLLYLHQKEARLWTTAVPERLRPGETWQARSVMLGMIHAAQCARGREAYRIAEAERLARGEPTQQEWAQGELPDLAQVTGWSRAGKAGASGQAGGDPTRALFGGWRMADLRRKRGEG